MGIRKFGTLYYGGQAVVPGSCALDNMPISIGDTAPGYELQWVEAGNRLVADRCACVEISWVALDSLGYIFGTPVEIDGKMYICRSLKVGTDEVVENEWDSLLNEFGDDDNLWHWLGEMFWGQEAPAYMPQERAVRGHESARAWSRVFKAHKSMFIGFRPVLEELSPFPLDLAPLIGKSISLYGPQKTIIEGVLTGFDEYDILIDGTPHLPNGCKWATVDRRIVTVNRDSVLHLQ